MNSTLIDIDKAVLSFFQKHCFWISRVAIFVVYFWFGVLKVVGTSPANPLVAGLLERTLPFITFDQFIVIFGILEMILGVLFLFPKLDRLSVLLFGLHMITTFMPLVLLPAVAWDAWFVPTLEGQYMIKNLVLIALVLNIASHVEPLAHKKEMLADA